MVGVADVVVGAVEGGAAADHRYLNNSRYGLLFSSRRRIPRFDNKFILLKPTARFEFNGIKFVDLNRQNCDDSRYCSVDSLLIITALVKGESSRSYRGFVEARGTEKAARWSSTILAIFVSHKVCGIALSNFRTTRLKIPLLF